MPTEKKVEPTVPKTRRRSIAAEKNPAPGPRRSTRASSSEKSPPTSSKNSFGLGKIVEEINEKPSTPSKNKDGASEVSTPKRRGRSSLNPTPAAVASPARVTRRSLAALVEEAPAVVSSPKRKSRVSSSATASPSRVTRRSLAAHAGAEESDAQPPSPPKRSTRKSILPKEKLPSHDEGDQKSGSSSEKSEGSPGSRPSSAASEEVEMLTKGAQPAAIHEEGSPATVRSGQNPPLETGDGGEGRRTPDTKIPTLINRSTPTGSGESSTPTRSRPSTPTPKNSPRIVELRNTKPSPDRHVNCKSRESSPVCNLRRNSYSSPIRCSPRSSPSRQPRLSSGESKVGTPKATSPLAAQTKASPAHRSTHSPISTKENKVPTAPVTISEKHNLDDEDEILMPNKRAKHDSVDEAGSSKVEHSPKKDRAQKPTQSQTEKEELKGSPALDGADSSATATLVSGGSTQDVVDEPTSDVPASEDVDRPGEKCSSELVEQTPQLSKEASVTSSVEIEKSMNDVRNPVEVGNEPPAVASVAAESQSCSKVEKLVLQVTNDDVVQQKFEDSAVLHDSHEAENIAGKTASNSPSTNSTIKAENAIEPTATDSLLSDSNRGAAETQSSSDVEEFVLQVTNDELDDSAVLRDSQEADIVEKAASNSPSTKSTIEADVVNKRTATDSQPADSSKGAEDEKVVFEKTVTDSQPADMNKGSESDEMIIEKNASDSQPADSSKGAEVDEVTENTATVSQPDGSKIEAEAEKVVIETATDLQSDVSYKEEEAEKVGNENATDLQPEKVVIETAAESHPDVSNKGAETEKVVIETAAESHPDVSNKEAEIEKVVIETAAESHPDGSNKEAEAEKVVIETAADSHPDGSNRGAETEKVVIETATDSHPDASNKGLETEKVTIESTVTDSHPDVSNKKTEGEKVVIKTATDSQPDVSNKEEEAEKVVIETATDSQPDVSNKEEEAEKVVIETATDSQPDVSNKEEEAEKVVIETATDSQPDVSPAESSTASVGVEGLIENGTSHSNEAAEPSSSPAENKAVDDTSAKSLSEVVPLENNDFHSDEVTEVSSSSNKVEDASVNSLSEVIATNDSHSAESGNVLPAESLPGSGDTEGLVENGDSQCGDAEQPSLSPAKIKAVNRTSAKSSSDVVAAEPFLNGVGHEFSIANKGSPTKLVAPESTSDHPTLEKSNDPLELDKSTIENLVDEGYSETSDSNYDPVVNAGIKTTNSTDLGIEKPVVSPEKTLKGSAILEITEDQNGEVEKDESDESTGENLCCPCLEDELELALSPSPCDSGDGSPCNSTVETNEVDQTTVLGKLGLKNYSTPAGESNVSEKCDSEAVVGNKEEGNEVHQDDVAGEIYERDTTSVADSDDDVAKDNDEVENDSESDDEELVYDETEGSDSADSDVEVLDESRFNFDAVPKTKVSVEDEETNDVDESCVVVEKDDCLEVEREDEIAKCGGSKDFDESCYIVEEDSSSTKCTKMPSPLAEKTLFEVSALPDVGKTSETGKFASSMASEFVAEPKKKSKGHKKKTFASTAASKFVVSVDASDSKPPEESPVKSDNSFTSSDQEQENATRVRVTKKRPATAEAEALKEDKKFKKAANTKFCVKLCNIAPRTTVEELSNALQQFGIAAGLLSLRFCPNKGKRPKKTAIAAYDTKKHLEKALTGYGNLKVHNRTIFFLLDDETAPPDLQLPSTPSKSPRKKFVGVISELSKEISIGDIVTAYETQGIRSINKVKIYKLRSSKDDLNFAKIEFSKKTALLKAIIVSENIKIKGQKIHLKIKEKPLLS